MSLETLLFAEEDVEYHATDMRGLVATFVRALGAKMMGPPIFDTSIGFRASPFDFAVTPGGGGGVSVTVGAGLGVVMEDSGSMKFYVVFENGASVVSLSNGDPSLPRVDLLCVHCRDNAIDAGGDNDAVYDIVEGTPGGGVPTDPGGQFMVLSEITVPAGATSASGMVIKNRAPDLSPRDTDADNVSVAPGGTADCPTSRGTYPSGMTKTVTVPAWASRALLWGQWCGAFAVTDTLNHVLGVELDTLRITGDRLRWSNSVVDANNRRTGDVPAKIVDCSALKGTQVTLRGTGERVSGSGAVRLDEQSMASVTVIFLP